MNEVSKELTMAKKCPCCKSDNLDLIGKIPSTDIFAGRQLLSPLEGHSLYSCKVCGVYFRFPRLPKNEMDELYRSGSEFNWTSAEEEKRVDWEIATKWINKNALGKRVLDVGCFRGAFLRCLGNDAKLYGIEIHELAAKYAEESGIEIIGMDFMDLDDHKCSFDVVTAFDVIEHTYDPKAFLAKLSAATKPGGSVIISTGNTNASSWRLMGASYWYCTISEHISFISPSWCKKNQSDCDLEVEEIQLFSHSPKRSSAMHKLREVGLNFIYRKAPSVFRFLRRRGFGGKDVRKFPELLDYPPTWMSATDHMIVRFKKK